MCIKHTALECGGNRGMTHSQFLQGRGKHWMAVIHEASNESQLSLESNLSSETSPQILVYVYLHM